MVSQGQHYLTSAQQRGKPGKAGGCTTCFLPVTFSLSIGSFSPLWKCHQPVPKHSQRYTTNIVFHVVLGLYSTQPSINIYSVIFFNISSVSSGYFITVYSQIRKLSYSVKLQLFIWDIFNDSLHESYEKLLGVKRDEKSKPTLN